ncbi:MAG: HAMP domain-containing protein [Burkholderiales bacterium]|nr:HAMP domain-containing protein [Phycisphaerae bacterium]
MFRWLRQLKISLATKCQLLFGVAVVLVICAALFVPWQRMEQLSEQPNESAARLLAEQTMRQHVDLQTSATTRPLLRAVRDVATRPTDEDETRYPRVIALARQNSDELSRFEKQSIQAFIKDPDRRSRSSLLRSSNRYRYAQPLLLRGTCLQCHASDAGLTPLGNAPTTQRVALADTPPLLGIVSVDIPSQTSGQQQLLNRVLLLIAGLIAGALAGVTLYLITTRIILKPVRVLQETAEKVSAGDLNIRSHINSGDEFQQLSETLNQMLANMKSSQDKLRDLNKSLDARLGQLAEANVALFESNKLKSEFIANVSHELRTPLNSILGFADLLKDSLPIETKQARYLQNIVNGGSSLLELINDLLDLAKIEAGKMEIRVQPIVLADLFEGLVNLLRPLCEQRKLTIAQSTEPGVPIIQTDGARLQQVLYNFLSNALKFSPESSTVRLTATKADNGRVRISVIDLGPGIAPDMQQVIFEKFRQADQSHTRQHGGTGLGLAIARELTGLLGGTIGVESEVGRGATFWCELPVSIEPGERLVSQFNLT